MQSTLAPAAQTLSLPTRWTMRAGKSAFRALTLLSTLAFAIGCASIKSPVGEGPGTSSSAGEVYMALSGGGWRAHTAQSAWMMGLLDACRANNSKPEDCSLETLLSNAKVISTNSGGSWFNTMLVYSADFHDTLTAPNSYLTWGSLPSGPAPSVGWLGYQRSLLGGAWDDYCDVCFDCNSACGSCTSTSCNSCNSCNCLDEAFAEKIAHWTDHPFLWMDTIKGIVFQPWGMAGALDSIRLSDMTKRLPWAKGKTLLIAATMVTDQVVLTESDSDYLYYTVPALAAGSVTPVSFASVMPPFRAPDFFSAGDMSLTYGKESTSADAAPAPVTINNTAVDGDVFVLDAVAASSAAGGAEASVGVEIHQNALAPWTDAHEASDLAPAFRFDKMPIEFQPGSALPTDLQTLASQKVARLADGGYLDNSAVAHVLNFLQKNNMADDFNIVAFDNVQQAYQPSTRNADPVPVDIAYLFGKGRPDNTEFCADVNDPETCVTVPIATVFEPDALESGINLWNYEVGENKLIYTKYSVTTVANPTLGVRGNTRGTLHVVASIYPSARTAPLTGDCDFATYNALVEFIHTGLTDSRGRGGIFLSQILSGSR